MNVVSFNDARRRPDPARVREFAETARRIERERTAATEYVARLLRETPRDEWPRLADCRALYTSAALDRLAAEVSCRLDAAPLDALAISTIAATIAEVLPPDPYPSVIRAQIRATAWTSRAQALSIIGRHEDALDATMRAESLLDGFGSVAHDRAIVRLVRATVLRNLDRHAECLELLAACREVFLDHGDARRHLYCGMTEGNLRFRQGAYEEARRVHASLFDVARSLGDVDALARLHNNVGHASVYLGDITVATMHFAEAMQQFESLGDVTNALRVDLGFGRVLLKRGEVTAALERLTLARKRFLEHGLVEEAALCGMTMIAAYIEQGERAAARALLARMQGEQGNARATAALRYLEERIEAHDAPAIVRHVESYLEALQANPALDFAVPSKAAARPSHLP